MYRANTNKKFKGGGEKKLPTASKTTKRISFCFFVLQFLAVYGRLTQSALKHAERPSSKGGAVLFTWPGIWYSGSLFIRIRIRIRIRVFIYLSLAIKQAFMRQHGQWPIR